MVIGGMAVRRPRSLEAALPALLAMGLAAGALVLAGGCATTVTPIPAMPPGPPVATGRAGQATAPPAPPAADGVPATPQPMPPATGAARGGYYLDDGPGDNPPDGLHEVILHDGHVDAEV